MAEPQPDADRPPAQSRPAGPTSPEPESAPRPAAEPDPGSETGPEPGPDPEPGSEPPTEAERVAAPDAAAPAGRGEPPPADPTAAVPGGRGAAEPTTGVLPPRWTGSAAVPPPAPGKRRWWGGGAAPGASPPEPRRDPTLELPSAELDAVEVREPVDPWADAAVDAWAHPPAGGWPHSPADGWAAHPDTSDWEDAGDGSRTPRETASPGPAPLSPTRRYPAPPVPGPASRTPVQPYPAPPERARRPAPPPPPRVAPPIPAQRKPPNRPARSGRRAAPVPPAGHGPREGWQPPPGYVAVAVRRRRRWPKVMALLTLLTVACCCGLPAYWGKPMWEQYPATASLPDRVADLSRRDDASSERTARELKLNMQMQHLLAEDTFAGVYEDPGGKRMTIFGTTGFRFSPDKDLDQEVTRLTEPYQLTDVAPVSTGTRGWYESCGTGRTDGSQVVLCTWADHGSLATVLFTRRSVDESAALVAELRNDAILRDRGNKA